MERVVPEKQLQQLVILNWNLDSHTLNLHLNFIMAIKNLNKLVPDLNFSFKGVHVVCKRQEEIEEGEQDDLGAQESDQHGSEQWE